MTYILGISCYYHDSAAALLRDGELVAAAQEERFSRRKHDRRFPDRALGFCLREAGIEARELEYVVFYEKPLRKFDRILRSSLHTFPRSWRTFGEAMIGWFDEKLWVRSTLQEKLGVDADQVLFTDHHRSHAASALFASPFREAAVLTVDGVGEWTTAALGEGRGDWDDGAGNELTLFEEQRFPHSLGLFYSAFTAWLGFRVNNGEYKVMGMASYGEPRHVDRVSQVIDVERDGSFRLDMDYFSFHYSPERTFSRDFVDLFGPPRSADEPFVVGRDDRSPREEDGALERSRYYADVAASVQKVTEEALLRSARHLREATGQENLCMAGGVALNSVANGRILRETDFEGLYVQPAASDAGGALGAALYAWHVHLGEPRRHVMDSVFYGEGYGRDRITGALESHGLGYETFDEPSSLVSRTADALADGQVVAWFEGRFEWGPRALGNRSILADPRLREMKDVVNEKVKFREPFRPFAPVVPADRASEYFVGCPAGPGPAPTDFMLAVLPWREEVRDEVPAVDHQGTGRVQTIRRSVQPRYYDLVTAFGERTGTPVLLNTSFNLRGQPIVSTPEEAVRTFERCGIDVLVLENCLVTTP